eukprot:TRINITY_DN6536_c0_g1_i1.p1 TRINITY_DN6536_c0_g1~~TRINITY_DN6536_c0_g1_i1.p1  ORF type:complete len:174 (+),score=34.59 TRINITY_DN6536_c0_g1_i1:200-721(+)
MVEYKEVVDADRQEIVDLLTETFCVHNVPCRELGLTFDEMRPVMELFFEQTKDCRYKALLDGKIAGVILVGHPDDAPPVLRGISEIMEDLYKDVEIPEKALLVHVTAVGGDYQGKGISSALRNMAFTHGQKNGYKYIMSESFSDITDHYYKSKGGKALSRSGPATLWCLEITA